MMELPEIKDLARRSAMIVVFAFLLGLAVNAVHPRGFMLVSRKSLELTKIIKISTDEGKIKFDHGSALFVDTRDGEEFAARRIQGSVNIPAYPDSLTIVKMKEHYEKLASPLELVLYCDAGCDSSEKIAGKIIELGYSRNIYLLKDGVKAWIDKGFPVNTGR